MELSIILERPNDITSSLTEMAVIYEGVRGDNMGCNINKRRRTKNGRITITRPVMIASYDIKLCLIAQAEHHKGVKIKNTAESEKL